MHKKLVRLVAIQLPLSHSFVADVILVVNLLDLRLQGSHTPWSSVMQRSQQSLGMRVASEDYKVEI